MVSPTAGHAESRCQREKDITRSLVEEINALQSFADDWFAKQKKAFMAQNEAFGKRAKQEKGDTSRSLCRGPINKRTIHMIDTLTTQEKQYESYLGRYNELKKGTWMV